MEDRFPIEEMKYGLMVIDRRELVDTDTDGNVTILHFAGYFKKPECADITALRKELSTDPSFGLIDVMEYCGIYDAPEGLVAEYREAMLSGEIPEEDVTLDSKEE